MDALELLHEDHEKVKELFEEAEGTENQKEKKRIFEEINSNWRLMRESKRLFSIRPCKSTAIR